MTWSTVASKTPMRRIEAGAQLPNATVGEMACRRPITRTVRRVASRLQVARRLRACDQLASFDIHSKRHRNRDAASFAAEKRLKKRAYHAESSDARELKRYDVEECTACLHMWSK